MHDEDEELGAGFPLDDEELDVNGMEGINEPLEPPRSEAHVPRSLQ